MSSITRLRCSASLLVSLSLSFVASTPPASAETNDAELAFGRFTDERVQALRARAELARTRPEVRPGPSSPLITYRAIGDEVRTELENTGVESVPFVGTLHYTEHVYSCDDVAATRCVEVASAPVTEIFRYRGGAWGH